VSHVRAVRADTKGCAHAAHDAGDCGVQTRSAISIE